MGKGRDWASLAEALQLGWSVAFSVLLPLLGGIFLDRWLGTGPWLTLLGVFLGLGAATVTVIRFAQEMAERLPPPKERPVRPLPPAEDEAPDDGDGPTMEDGP